MYASSSSSSASSSLWSHLHLPQPLYHPHRDTQLMKHGMFENRKESFMAKRPCLIMAMTVVTFAVILGIVRMMVTQNFVIMASQLLVEFSWLIGVILVSILLRVDNDKIKNTFRIYSPLMLVGFIVIVFRIILIPNDLVNLIFPPILLLCSLWQWNVIGRSAIRYCVPTRHTHSSRLPSLG